MGDDSDGDCHFLQSFFLQPPIHLSFINPSPSPLISTTFSTAISLPHRLSLNPSSGTWDVETDDITSYLSNNDSGHETEVDDDMEMESGNESDDDRNTDPLDLSNHEPSLNSRVDEMTHCNGEMIVNHQRTSFRRNSQQIQLVEIVSIDRVRDTHFTFYPNYPRKTSKNKDSPFYPHS